MDESVISAAWERAAKGEPTLPLARDLGLEPEAFSSKMTASGYPLAVARQLFRHGRKLKRQVDGKEARSLRKVTADDVAVAKVEVALGREGMSLNDLAAVLGISAVSLRYRLRNDEDLRSGDERKKHQQAALEAVRAHVAKHKVSFRAACKALGFEKDMTALQQAHAREERLPRLQRIIDAMEADSAVGERLAAERSEFRNKRVPVAGGSYARALESWLGTRDEVLVAWLGEPYKAACHALGEKAADVKLMRQVVRFALGYR